MVLSNYNVGWNEEFARYPGMKLEYVPLDVAWKAAFFVGMKEHYPHFFAKSGYFSIFIYDPDRFWVYDIFQVQLVENALNGCNIQRYTLKPNSIREALEFIRQMINSGNLVWATYFEPILIYGIEGNPGSERLYWYSPRINPDGTIWGKDEIEQWWDSQEQIGTHTLIAPARVAPGANSPEEIVSELARLAVENAQTDHLDLGEDLSVPFGLAAYDRYIADLRNPEFDFTRQFGDDKIMYRMAWLSVAIYSLWTQYFAAHTYFSHIANLFPEKQAEALHQAARHYGNAYGHWLEWEKFVGRVEDEKEFIERARSMERRNSAADAVEKAKNSVKQAVDSLARYIELRGQHEKSSDSGTDN